MILRTGATSSATQPKLTSEYRLDQEKRGLQISKVNK